MNRDKQQEIWIKRTEHMSKDDIVALYNNPSRFQTEFSEYINNLGKNIFKEKRITICELGCESGITSLLLSSDIFKRHCLDLNQHVLKILNKAANELGQDIELHHEDMFQTSFKDATFDIIFSNGVLEHYSFGERKEILRECARIIRPEGKVFIGIPNHFSMPYRFSYKLQVWFHRWAFPPEEKIKDLSGEISEIPSLEKVNILFFDKENLFNLLPKPKYTTIFFRLLDRICNFKPYLRVIELQRLLEQKAVNGQ